MNQAMKEHTCNAYCREDEHCDLLWTGALDDATGTQVPQNPDVARYSLALQYWQDGVTLVRIVPATEAPPLASVPSDHTIVVGDVSLDEHRWLVWFRERRDGDQPPWKRAGHYWESAQ